MGGGSWSSTAYVSDTKTRRLAGTDDFDYSVGVTTGKYDSKVHETLDATKMVNGIRESRDSDEHPNSLPVAVIFDVTGSMLGIPRTLQTKLAALMDVLLKKTGVKDPQILMGAVGDSTCDRYPFQVGQFESDNSFDEQLRNIILEGCGGGQDMESYGLAFRFAAHHVETDSFDKRGKKGYFITIGDERAWPTVSAEEISRIFGVQVDENETVESLIAKAKEKWELFHIFPLDASHGRNETIKDYWKNLLGERVIMLEDQNLVCEVIAGLVGMLESAYDLDKVVDKIGLTGKDRNTVKNALVSAEDLRVSTHVAVGNLPDAHTSSLDSTTKI